ncbi:hypothetical protein [Aeromicrobium sp.]|uniref:hypothetical protein n=1 Tax=Aeromicrobium sp. TaxID=1871063 RepID=UPI004034AC48
MKAIRITALAGEERLGPFAAPPDGEILLGRSAVNGLVLEEDWAPRLLAILVPTPRSWLVVNGPSARMQGKSAWGPIDAPPDAIVAVPGGITDLRWTAALDHMRVKLNVGGSVDALPVLRPEEEDVEVLRAGRIGTQWVPDREAGPDLLEPQQRHTMAHLFRHLLDGTPRPKNITRPAAEALGISVDTLKKRAGVVRDRVNRERFQKLGTLDELGEYLVERAGVVTIDDLRPPPRARSMVARARERRQRDSPGGA